VPDHLDDLIMRVIEAELDDPQDRSGPFAAEVVARVLPDDPAGRAALMRKAAALGVRPLTADEVAGLLDKLS